MLNNVFLPDIVIPTANEAVYEIWCSLRLVWGPEGCFTAWPFSPLPSRKSADPIERIASSISLLKLERMRRDVNSLFES